MCLHSLPPNLFGSNNWYQSLGGQQPEYQKEWPETENLEQSIKDRELKASNGFHQLCSTATPKVERKELQQLVRPDEGSFQIPRFVEPSGEWLH